MVDIDTLPDSALLRLHDLLGYKLWPGGRSSFWLAVRDGRFPPAVKVNERTTAWRLGDVRAWQRSLAPTASQEALA